MSALRKWCILVERGHAATSYYTGCRGIDDTPVLTAERGDALAYWTEGSATADLPQARRALPRARLFVEPIR